MSVRAIVVGMLAWLAAAPAADAAGRTAPPVRSGAASCDDKRQSLIRSLYRDRLGREPDTAALTQFATPS